MHHQANTNTLPSLTTLNSSRNSEGSPVEHSGFFYNDTAFSHYLPISDYFDKQEVHQTSALS